MLELLTFGGFTLLTLVYQYVTSDNNGLGTHHDLKQFKGDDGFLVSKHFRLSSKYSNEHVFVGGPTGSGKTSRIIKHNVQTLKNCSIICTDPDGTISRDVIRDDCKVYVFNPLNPEISIGFNPIELCTNTMEVRNMVDNLILNGMSAFNRQQKSDDEKWIKMAAPLLKAYAILNFKFRRYNFADMITNLLVNPLSMYVAGHPNKINIKSIEYEIAKSNDVEIVNEFKSFIKIQSSPETLACIQNVLSTSLQLFNDINVKKLCSKPTLNLKKFRQCKSILYIQVPEAYSTYFAPLVSVYLQQIMNIFRDNYKGLPIRFVLDELCNIGIIPNFDNYLSSIRRYGMGILGCTQCLAQLNANYGDVRTKIILENFNTICALPGLKDSAEYFSSLLGTFDKNVEGTIIKSQVLSIDELRRLDDNKILIICKNKRGVIDTAMPQFTP